MNSELSAEHWILCISKLIQFIFIIYLFYLFIYSVTHKTLYNMNKSC